MLRLLTIFSLYLCTTGFRTAHATCTTEVFDFNDGTMQGWTSYGSYSSGNSGGSINISGDSGGCTLQGIQMAFPGANSLTVSYDWVSSSSYAYTNNQAFSVKDASTNDSLFGEYSHCGHCGGGGTSASGSYSKTLTTEIAGVSTVNVVLGLYDCWSTNWSQTNTLDNISVEVCTNDSDGDGYSTSDGDCDDSDPNVNPSASEVCDSFDNNCDGNIDEGTAIDALTWYDDSDLDGYGNPNTPMNSCSQPSGYVADYSDCDDGEETTFPGADEYCDSIDNNCDGSIDEDTAIDALTWYDDSDFDGYGNPNIPVNSCSQPSGYVADYSDCDDTLGATNPSASEVCDSIDNNCDGGIDEYTAIDALTWYDDSDFDGYGNPNDSMNSCSQPTGYVADYSDCNDGEETTYPGADEYCDGYDNNCNGNINENSAVDALNWYQDSDLDGYGNSNTPMNSCSQPTGYVADYSDCDDQDNTIHVEAEEIWYDGIDQNCDEWSDFDQDGDGFDHLDDNGDDCDDQDNTIHMEAEEIWYDGIDQNCDEWSDFDQDGDGQDSETYGGEDCDDSNLEIYTGALDEPYDGLITDCSNADDYDADGDGEVSEAFEGSDCDDSNSSIYSEAEEVWYDGIDQNCDENDNDQDEDGWILDEDCDDTDAESYPDNGELDSDCAQILSSLETEQNDKEGCSTASVKGRHLNPLALLLVGWIGTRRRRWT